jgi:hypothetical protein
MNSIDQNPPYEANSHSASHHIVPFLDARGVLSCSQEPGLVPAVSLINSALINTSYFFKMGYPLSYGHKDYTTWHLAGF